MALVIACSRSRPAVTDSASSYTASASPATQPQSAVAATNSPSRGACPRTGKWALCSVEKRLEQSGFVVRKSGEAPLRRGFSVAPVVYTLGRARLELFLYPDEAALSRDIANIDTLSASPRGAPSQWETPPTFVRSANLVAVFLTDSQQQAERLTLAITAGAPQP
ncbi:MAG: hypothetical protein ACJ8AJ_02415 [Gemmatimonadaceae bacterium]